VFWYKQTEYFSSTLQTLFTIATRNKKHADTYKYSNKQQTPVYNRLYYYTPVSEELESALKLSSTH